MFEPMLGAARAEAVHEKVEEPAGLRLLRRLKMAAESAHGPLRYDLLVVDT